MPSISRRRRRPISLEFRRRSRGELRAERVRHVATGSDAHFGREEAEGAEPGQPQAGVGSIRDRSNRVFLHDLSERRQGPFIPINCSALPENLLESELFGHRNDERG